MTPNGFTTSKVKIIISKTSAARGVWNGLRAEPLCPRKVHTIGEQMCGKDCKQELPCLFMKEYYKYLKTLDFLDIITRAELLAKKAVAPEDGEPFVVFLVNEPHMLSVPSVLA